MELGEGTNYEGFAERYAQAWLNGMCRLVGLPEHPLEECLRIERQAAEFVTPRVHAALPWSAEAVHSLVGLGFHLHTASGERSWELEGYLAGMGIRGCFQHLYGSDLVGHFKSGPEYYERVFADARIAARDAVVVDDTPKAIGWAKQVGARTVLVSTTLYTPAADMAIPNLASLLTTIRAITSA